MGDIVIFHPREGAVAKPEWYEDDVFIKRIVATAGDTVEARPSACLCSAVHLFLSSFVFVLSPEVYGSVLAGAW